MTAGSARPPILVLVMGAAFALLVASLVIGSFTTPEFPPYRVTVPHPKAGRLTHIVSYRPGEKAPHDHGPVSVSNPGFTPLTVPREPAGRSRRGHARRPAPRSASRSG